MYIQCRAWDLPSRDGCYRAVDKRETLLVNHSSDMGHARCAEKEAMQLGWEIGTDKPFEETVKVA